MARMGLLLDSLDLSVRHSCPVLQPKRRVSEWHHFGHDSGGEPDGAIALRRDLPRVLPTNMDCDSSLVRLASDLKAIIPALLLTILGRPSDWGLLSFDLNRLRAASWGFVDTLSIWENVSDYGKYAGATMMCMTNLSGEAGLFPLIL